MKDTLTRSPQSSVLQTFKPSYLHTLKPCPVKDFPGKTLVETSIYTDTDLGKLNCRVDMFDGEGIGKNIFYTAAETKYPEGFLLTEENKEAQYSKSIKGALNSTNATLIERKTLQRDGHEIIEIYASMYEDTAFAIYRIFWIKNAAYLQAVISEEKGMTEEAEAFFDSFELME